MPSNRVLIHGGKIWYASKPMSEGRAQARLRKLAERLEECAMLCQVGGWTVLHRPTTPTALEELRRAAEAESYQKGFAALPHMEWAHKEGQLWCLGTGGWYRVSEHACSCPHYALRCAGVGILCKHQAAAKIRGLI